MAAGQPGELSKTRDRCGKGKSSHQLTRRFQALHLPQSAIAGQQEGLVVQGCGGNDSVGGVTMGEVGMACCLVGDLRDDR